MRTSCAIAAQLITLCTAAHAGDAAIHVISCPAKIQTAQKLSGAAPVGWAEFPDADGLHWLAGVSFSTGHPSEQVTLLPDNSNESMRGRKRVWYWTFTDTNGLYATCNYGQTTVQLTQPVPAGYRRCEVRYERTSAMQMVRASCSK